MRRLPAWTPVALVLFGVALYILQHEIPREGERADTLMEAFPFTFFFLGLLAVPFSEGKVWKWVGLALAVLVITYQLWIGLFIHAEF